MQEVITPSHQKPTSNPLCTLSLGNALLLLLTTNYTRITIQLDSTTVLNNLLSYYITNAQ